MSNTSFEFKGRDGTLVRGYRWSAEGPTKAILQIAHGMGEHAARYEEPLRPLRKAGVTIYANDHRGHGKTGPTLGDFGPGGFAGVVDDMAVLSEIARKENPGKKLVLLGHSMGSFALQIYLVLHSKLIDAAVISGSACLDMLPPPDPSGNALEAFNKPFEPARTPFDWLTRDSAEVDKYIADPLCGFSMNEEMRRKYCPDTFRMNDPIGDKDDGMGIMLGLGAGGEAIHMEQFFTTCPWTMPEPQAKGVFVNVQGQRFINEDCYHGRVSRCAVDQAGGKVYLLLDNAHFSQPMDFARIAIAGTGDTWEEVEAELKMPAGTLSATMAFYNSHARAGSDPLFGKRAPILTPLDQGPFVALELNFQTSYFSFFTLGGLRTSTDGEVLDRAGAPLPGLFAAGRCTSGLPAWGYGYSSGMSLADCTFFGRRAGRKAARG